MENWQNIGKSIFSVNVQENENGIRRYFLKGKVVLEKKVEVNVAFLRYDLNNLDHRSLLINTILKEKSNDLLALIKEAFVVHFSHFFPNLSKQDILQSNSFKTFLENVAIEKRLFCLSKWKNDDTETLKQINKNYAYWVKQLGFNNKAPLDYQFSLFQFINDLLYINKQFGKMPISEFVEFVEYSFDAITLPLANEKRQIFSINHSNNENEPESNLALFKDLKAYFENKQANQTRFVYQTNKPKFMSDELKALFQKEKVLLLHQHDLEKKETDFFHSIKQYAQNNQLPLCIFSTKPLEKKEGNEVIFYSEELNLSYFCYFFHFEALLGKYKFPVSVRLNNRFFKKRNVDHYLDNDNDLNSVVDYIAKSQSSPPQGKISKAIAEPVYQALLNVESEFSSVDDWIAGLLNVSKESLPERLSAEQIDAISLAIRAMLKGKGFILSDETGFGKGRILATIAIIGLNLGKSIVFITEKKQLFSDFYRDLSAVKPEMDIRPAILNEDGEIYDSEGKVVVKKHTAKSFKNFISSKEWEEGEIKLLLTNYAQINRKNSKKTPNLKVACIDRLLGDNAWVILDESHNASGESNIYENVKTLLSKKGREVVFSSATYAKNEDKLHIYKKAFPQSSTVEKLFKLSMFNDEGAVREFMAKEMARQGTFIRREHPPIPLPKVELLPLNEKKQKAIAQFSQFFNALFRLLEEREKLAGVEDFNIWEKAGGVLSRSIREMSMSFMIDDIVRFVKERIDNNEKVVLVTEITFESTLKAIVSEEWSDSDSEEEEGKTLEKDIIFSEKPTWGKKWKTFIKAIIDKDILFEEMDKRVKRGEIRFYDKRKILEDKNLEILGEQVIQLANNCNLISASPIDELKQKVEQLGISVGELSGRGTRLVGNLTDEKDEDLTFDTKMEKGKWGIQSFNVKKPREEIVSDFNSGKTNCLILTKAGASGISLHAGEKFKDQRKRVLCEWDISANTADRLQFLGRVRRKDMVVEPDFVSFINELPYDKRKIEREKRKYQTLSAHVGHVKKQEDLDWYSLEGDMILEEWARERSRQAKHIGAFYHSKNEPFKRLDRALSRSIILPVNEMEAMLERIDLGIKCHKEFYQYQKSFSFTSQELVSKFFMGNEHSFYEKNRYCSSLNIEKTNVSLRKWEVNSAKKEQNVLTLKLVVSQINNVSNESKCKQIIQMIKEEANKTINGDEKFLNSAFSWLERVLPKFEYGSLIEMEFDELFSKTGIILDLGFEKGETKGGCSTISLNTSYVNILFENEDNPIKVPLYVFAKRKLGEGYRIYNIEKNKIESYFNSLQKSFIATTVEGNPFLVSILQKAYKIGKLIYVQNGKETELAWLLPKQYNFAKMETLPLPIFISKFLPKLLVKLSLERSNQEKENLLLPEKERKPLPNQCVFSDFDKEKAEIALSLSHIYFKSEFIYKKYVAKLSHFIQDVEVLNQKSCYAKARIKQISGKNGEASKTGMERSLLGFFMSEQIFFFVERKYQSLYEDFLRSYLR